MRTWTVALLLLAVTLAGCSDGEAPAPEPDESFQPVVTDSDLGAISGVVVDEAILPVVGATVTVQGLGLTTETNEGGQFVVEELEPGTYFLDIAAPAFLPVQSSVTVAAGEVATLRIQIQSDPAPQPYHETVAFDGFMQLYLSIASFAVEVFAPGAQGCTCAFNHTPNPGVETLVMEVYGEPSITSNPTPVYGDIYWELISQDNPDTAEDEFQIESSHDFYPVYVVRQIEEFPPNTEEWLVRVTGSQWFHLDESYELFLTTFYHEPAPEGWKFNPDA